VIQQIPLNGGLVTQVDGEEVSINACTELINAEFDKQGLVYKRKGSASGVDTNKAFVSITRWYNTNIAGDYYWIGIDDADAIWHSTDLSTWNPITFTPAITIDDEVVKVVNYNTQLRFPCGLTDDARIYQYIDRDFFWGSYNTSPGFETDKAKPQAIPYTLSYAGKLATDYESGMTHTTKFYQYKVTFIYDGNQETALPELSAVASNAMLVLTDQADADTDVFTFALKFAQADWNNRVTGINIYRKQGTGGYFKVASASTLSKANDSNLQLADANAFVTKVMVDSSNGLTSSINGKELYISGFAQTIATTQNAQFASMTDAVNTTIGNTWGTYMGHTDAYIQVGISPTREGTSEVPGWFVGDTVTNGTNGIYDLEGTTAGSWSSSLGSSITVSQATDQKKYGASSLKFANANGSPGDDTHDDQRMHFTLGTDFTTSDTLIISYWVFIKHSEYDSPGVWKLGIDDTTGAGATSAEDTNAGLYYGGTGLTSMDKWRHVQVELAVSDIPSYSNGTNLYLRCKNSGASGGNLWLDNLLVTKKVYNTTVGRLGIGSDVVASTSFDLGGADSAEGWAIQIGGNAITPNSIKNNYQYSFKAQTGSLAVSTSQTVNASSNYVWKTTGTNHELFFRDLDAIDGVFHPTGETSLDTKYRHSKFINGRNYVADVRISNGADTEDHENWVMFSELNQPDVIPISNYIQLTDAQGGKIIGIESLMGDLAVLMENGIFRLSIPSYDPTQWSLSEAEENIGCVSENSITPWESGLFFAGKDHLYYLDVNFKATAMTASIKDDYQGLVDENARTFYDSKKNRLLCKFGADGATIYSLDLSLFPEERWTKVTSGSGDMDIFTLNENLALYSYDESTQYIKLHDDSKAEGTSFKRTTGWVSQENIDRSGVLRRFNIKYNTTASVYIGVKIYIDGDDTTAVQWGNGNTYHVIPPDTSGADWYKCKPNVRCRSYKIEIYESDVSGVAQSSTGDLEIRRLEVEFE